MRRIFQFLRERIFRMRLKRAIRKAETLRRMTGKKHLVVRWKNEPVVVSKQNRRNPHSYQVRSPQRGIEISINMSQT